MQISRKRDNMERYDKYELLIGGILEGFIFGTLSFGIISLGFGIIVFLGVLIGGVYLARKGNDLESKRKKRNTSQPNQ